MAIYLTIGPLKPCSRMEPVQRCEPSTYQPISRSGLVQCITVAVNEVEILTHLVNGVVVFVL